MPGMSQNSFLLFDEKKISDLSNMERKKYLQKTRLLKYVYEHRASTMAEIFTAIGISSPTCQILINELISDDVLEKKGKGESIGGRKPDIYQLKDGTFYVVSLDMERFKTRIAIFDNNNNNISGVTVLPVGVTRDQSSIEDLHHCIKKLILSSAISKERLLGIGICMPGLIDAEAGTSATYLKTDDETKSLQQVLSGKFEYPVFLQNDVKCAAIAESRYGLAKGVSDALVLLMDWGIGLGIIMDGKMRKGSKGYSGEIGHIPFIDEGALCYCGKKGCLETVASGIALARMAKEGIKSGQHSLLNELSNSEIDKIEPHVVIDAANRGDQYAISILSTVGSNLGKGIATLIQLFNPEVIILGGKIAQAKQYITIPIIQSINTYSMTEIRGDTRIVSSMLGEDTGILGMVSIVIDNILEQQIKYLESC
jgi:N-acetylglucosamine repressor